MTTAHTQDGHEDGNLPEARRKLSNAISALIDPKPHTLKRDDGTTVEWLDSLYVQLVEAVPGERKHRTGVSASQPPMWVDASDQLGVIDRTVTSWHPQQPIFDGDLTPEHPPTPPTVARLQSLEATKWRPQDCSLLDGYTAQLVVWCDKITELLADAPKLTLPNPCPACGTKIVYRHDSAGDLVRRPALHIGANGCTCQHCRHTWGPELFTHLARVLGYEMPAGVLE